MKAGRANFFHARTEVDPDDQTTSFARSNSLSDDVTDEGEQRSSSETKNGKKVKVLRGSRGPYTKHSARTQRRKKQNLLNAAAGFTKIDLSSFDRADAVKKSNPLTVKSNPLTVKPSMTSPGCKKQQTMTDFFVS